LDSLGNIGDDTVNIQEFVEYIAKSLVEDPTQVQVDMVESANGVNLELHVASNDMGRVIGKGGRVANAIRTLVRVAAVRQGKRATLEVVDQASPEKHAAARP
jgi:predicted RNA-binding protein YlqC (UPF0109 family)